MNGGSLAVHREPMHGRQAAVLPASLAVLVLLGSTGASAAASIPTHCWADEKVYFSCRFKNGKTASLCASADLNAHKGTLQYRFGVVGKRLELSFLDTDDPEKYQPARTHPKYWFDWSSSYTEKLPNGMRFGSSNSQWSPKNRPAGYTVETSLRFSPIAENAAISFSIVSWFGPDARVPGVTLFITESVAKGVELARLRCMPSTTIDDLFLLRDIITR